MLFAKDTCLIVQNQLCAFCCGVGTRNITQCFQAELLQVCSMYIVFRGRVMHRTATVEFRIGVCLNRHMHNIFREVIN